MQLLIGGQLAVIGIGVPPSLSFPLTASRLLFSFRVAAKNTAESGGRTGRGGIAFLVVALALAGSGAWYWNGRKTEASASASSSEVKSTLHLETFVLNLADPDQRAYLRVGIDLGLSRELGKGNDAPPVSRIRDTILTVLGQCRADDLLTEAGKNKLKADVLHALQERVPEQRVQEVYFTELLIQK
jgi:flagellar basal body-associated protein FliL